MDKHLHIVCFDVPYPPNYGGVIDVFFRIISLHKLGIKIHLHCFDYGRGKQIRLNSLCEQINYYNRKHIKGISFRLPYIVKSRANKNLLQNLKKDDHPILLEGIHCTYFLYSKQLKNRKVFVRLHNIEFEYYLQLSKSETSFFKKIYFEIESYLLEKYERLLGVKSIYFAISQKDVASYRKKFNATHVRYLPAFLPYQNITAKEGKGDYCLYHGNLSIPENEKAVMWLLKNVFINLNTPFIISGKEPSNKIKKYIEKKENISLIANPTESALKDLVSNAQINILPSFNSAGVKIKVLNALFTGRHCLVNGNAIAGSGLELLCFIANDAKEFTEKIKQLIYENFTREEKEKRKNILEKQYHNDSNAKQLMQWIY